MTRLALVLALALIGMSPRTSIANDGYDIAGAGASSCGAYLEDRATGYEPLRMMYTSWLQGFLTGMNFSVALNSGRHAAIPDAPTLLAYVDKYCRDNPLHDVHKAASKLYADLPRR